MALSADYSHPIFIDSSYRNRRAFPLPSEFEVVIKPGTGQNPNDPLGIGYPMYQDGVSGSYQTGDAGGPGWIGLANGIDPAEFNNAYLGKYVEVVNPTTLISKGQSTVAGFIDPGSVTGTIPGVFITAPISNAATGDLFYIRQFTSVPQFRLKATTPYATGTTQITMTGGSLTNGTYTSSYLYNIKQDGTPSRISNYTGGVATVFPLDTATSIGDILEVYTVKDNESGMSLPGSMAAKSVMVNHRISLVWVRIPRRPLYVDMIDVPTSIQTTINILPFILIRFSNSTNGTIQSNNPIAHNAQFVLPIEELSTDIGEFFTLRCPEPIVIKFNPSEPIRFGVYFPDGTPLTFAPDDVNASVLEVPNPDLQICALFTVKRELN